MSNSKVRANLNHILNHTSSHLISAPPRCVHCSSIPTAPLYHMCSPSIRIPSPPQTMVKSRLMPICSSISLLKALTKFLRQQVLWPHTSKPWQPTRSGIACWEWMPRDVLLYPYSPGKTPALAAPPPNFVPNSTRTLFIHEPAPEFMPVTGQRNYVGSQQHS